MEYFYTTKHLNVLKSFAAVNTLFAFDYDGTLAPIVSAPENAKMSHEVIDLMIEINKITPVAILTGRSVSDVKKLLPFEPKFIIGNHGMEGMLSSQELDRIRTTCKEWMNLLTRHLTPYFMSLGITIEDKEYSLSIHYRNCSDPVVCEEIAYGLMTHLPAARITKGKCVLNVVPVNGLNKGQALARLMKENGHKFGFFIGDDVTDEDVFSYRNPRLLTIRVGDSKTSKAKYFIKGQEEIIPLLQNILNFRKDCVLASSVED